MNRKSGRKEVLAIGSARPNAAKLLSLGYMGLIKTELRKAAVPGLANDSPLVS